MNFELLSVILFYASILLVVFFNRKKFDIEGIIFLYKTKIGLSLMDRFGKISKKFMMPVSILSISLGFLGMVAIFATLLFGIYSFFFRPAAKPVMGLVLPGIRIPGSPVFVPLWYGLISIFVVATVHEFMHGVFARHNKVKVKSSGIVFLGPIVGAFVEPDEKKLAKKSDFVKLSVFSAGPFSNIILGLLLMLLVSFIVSPIALSLLDPNSLVIAKVNNNSLAQTLGIQENEVISSINNYPLSNISSLKEELSKKKVSLGTNKANYTFNNSQFLRFNKTLGVFTKVKYKEKLGHWFPTIFFNFFQLLNWIILLNFGIGLANLLPMGPIDGGRMLQVVTRRLYKKKKKADFLWKAISWSCLLLLLINVFYPIIKTILKI